MKKKLLFLSCIIFSFAIVTLINPVSVNSEAPILLEGLYATSVNINYEKNGPHNLFDDRDTYWATMPGAAPDEGVMLYFEKKTYIGRMELKFPATAGISKIKKFQIYVNGVDRGTLNASTPARINKEVKSLYVRIIDVQGMNSMEVKSDIKGFTKTQKSYKSDLPAGISEMIFFDRNGTRLKVVPPKRIGGKVIASSTLEPEEAYSIDYLFDSKLDSGWVEGKKGSGAGSTIKFVLNDSVNISKIKIWNGMLMSGKHYRANERVKKFFFGTSDAAGHVYSLKDSMKPQTVNLKTPLSGKNLTFKINQVYHGSAYKDCVLTEMRFYQNGSWFMIDTSKAEMRKRKNISRIKGTVLKDVVDKLLRVNYREYGSSKSRSIILRSNNSFVVWLEDEESNYSKSSFRKKVLDGFWDIRALSKNRANVRLLGKSFNISREFEMYKGDRKSERVSIFYDILDITPHAIKGKKHLGTITY